MVMVRKLKGAAAVAALPVAAAVLGSAAVLAAPAPALAAPSGADLKILSPRAGDTLGTAQFDLDVSFRSKSKSPITIAELWVDNVRWVRRELSRPDVRGVLSFAVDGSTLAEGRHSFVVKVVRQDGETDTRAIVLNVGSNDGEAEGDVGGPDLQFPHLTNGQHVTGVVDLALDTPTRAEAPYISFFVDKQFKTLKNYPPYAYALDTTQLENGFHTVEVVAFSPTTKRTATRRMKIYVDNPGGNTVRMDTVPDLTAKAAAPISAAATVRPLEIPLGKRVAAKSAPKLSAPTSPARLAAPLRSLPDVAAVGAFGHEDAAVSGATDVVLSVRAALPASVPAGEISPTIPAAAANSVVAPVATPTALRTPETVTVYAADLRTPTAVPVAARTVAVVPSEVFVPRTTLNNATRTLPSPTTSQPITGQPATGQPVAGVLARSAKTVKTVGFTKAAPQPRIVPSSVSVGAAGPLQVAFNGTQVAFDVPPRVEAGVPLAPFRQIFERSGGIVQWVANTKVVRAVNADREVVLHIGENVARVNDRAVTLETPTYIDRGRAIVPLSFISDALNVKVEYDAATGRLQITSKS